MKIKCQILALLLTLVAGCGNNKRLEPFTLVIGSWYGFYPIYYAIENSIDLKHGLRLKVVEPTNISDLRRSYLRDQVDAVATSMIEYTTAYRLSGGNIKPVLITDYSNGGDVVIAHRDVKNASELQGMRIAVPGGGIGEYTLSLVFDSMEPSTLFKQLNLPETECGKAFADDIIDACVTYPPISTYLLENENLHSVYSSKSHPGRIFDVLWSKSELPIDTVNKIRSIWFDVIEKIESDPEQFYHFVSQIVDLPVEKIQTSMDGITLINKEKYQELISDKDKLNSDLQRACVITKSKDCEQYLRTTW